MLTDIPTADRDAPQSQKLSTPVDFARSMMRPATLSTSGDRWTGISLQRFQVPAFDIDLAGSRVHRVTLHLGGPILIHRKRANIYDQRWSDVGYSNVVPTRVPTARSFSMPADFIVAYVDPAAVEEVAAEAFYGDPSRLELIESFATHDDRISRIINMLLSEAGLQHSASRLLIDTFARALMLHLVRSYSSTSYKEMSCAIDYTDRRLRRAIDYMHENLAHDLPLDELAKAACLSVSHFTRIFRTATGFSPHQYLVKLRIRKAQRLLRHTSLSIIDIALRCGFEQAAHFATAFRKTCGVSPSAYRAERIG